MGDIFKELPYLKRKRKSFEIPQEFKPIFNIISKSPARVDKIVEETGLAYPDVMEILLNLEMLGVVIGENGVFSLCV